MTPTQLLDRQARLLTSLQTLEDDLRENSSRLATTIRESRDAAGLSNKDIAQRTNLPYTSVVNWVYGNVMIPEKAAEKILKLFHKKRGPKPRP